MPTTTPEFRGAAEACKRIGIDRSTLSRWVKDGTAAPAMRLPGKTGAFLFTDEEIDRLAEWYTLNGRKAVGA